MTSRVKSVSPGVRAFQLSDITVGKAIVFATERQLPWPVVPINVFVPRIGLMLGRQFNGRPNAVQLNCCPNTVQLPS